MPTEPKKTSTPTLISALRILAAEVESDDGVANMTIAEGADRIEELSSENARLENLTASGIHTCSTSCQRPMCVMRRELALVKAERDEAVADYERLTGLLSGRFPQRDNGSLPDWKIEDVLTENAALRRDKAKIEHELFEHCVSSAQHAKEYEEAGEIIGQLRQDKERLDWLMARDSEFDRPAIDAAMKGGRDE